MSRFSLPAYLAFERGMMKLLAIAAVAALVYLASVKYQDRRILHAAIEQAERDQAVLLRERCAIAVGGILGIRAELDGDLPDEIALPILRDGCGPDARIEDYPELFRPNAKEL